MEDLTGYEIAVIGMAGRFPGAGSVEEYWENLTQGKESIHFFTPEDQDPTGMSETPGYVGAKGLLDGVHYFDATFFNYTLPEADIMDPQLRLLHECSWQALEDAAYNPYDYPGSIGLYVGAGMNIYWYNRIMNRPGFQGGGFAAMTVNSAASISTQIAYRLNLKGPAMTLQTACSTSLVAIHNACQALLSGECHMALAGGVSVTLPLKTGYIYVEGMVLSPDGHCRAFDAQSDGCISGNGVGVVVLKPLENALEDHDHIYAIVKGTAVNNDGSRKMGYAAPSVTGQADVIRTALQAAEVEAETVTYIETHGTGTRIGDPVEIRALTNAFNTDKKQFCRIGSVKTNIGHLDAAAGVAGFIKAALSLYHRQIPPSLHYHEANREIDFQNSPFMVNTRLHDWQQDGPLRAGVSSFGIGGTNAHLILEQSPQTPASPASSSSPKIIMLSARTETALDRNSRNLARFLTKHPEVNFDDVIYTLQQGRKPFEYRRTLVCRNKEEAAAALSLEPETAKQVSATVHTRKRIGDQEPDIIFMFSGLGSQYVNMGRGLYETEPLFRDEMDRCFAILEPLLDYNLKDVLYPVNQGQEGNGPSINRSDVAQAVVFVVEYALARLLMARGIVPQAMIGYSFGEYTAACLAGVFGLEDALSLIVDRGLLVKQTPEGAMLSVPIPSDELLPLLSSSQGVSLAIDNGPSCIVAGLTEDIHRFEKKLKEKKYLCMRINTTQGIHSPLMQPITGEFRQKVAAVPLEAPKLRYISNLTGTWVTPEEVKEPQYWVTHLSSTVRFNEGVQELVKNPCAVFMELGPGRDLSALVQRSLGENHRVVNMVRPQAKKIEDSIYLLERVGMLWSYGKTLDWTQWQGIDRSTCYRVSLPPYSFDPQAFVIEDDTPMIPAGQSGPGDDRISYAVSSPTFERSQLPDNYVPPSSELEIKVAEAFQGIFGLDKIGVHDDFFELGGDSLKVISLVTGLHRQLDVDLAMDEVFSHSSVKELADYIGEKAGQDIFSNIPAVEERDYYPLSPQQKRVFIMEQIEEKGRAYNETPLLWLEGPLDKDKLAHAYLELVKRHEALRSSFFMKDGEPVQRVIPVEALELGMGYSDLSDTGEGALAEVIDGFLTAFDLSSPPLWEMELVKVAPDKFLLMQKIHHIISDDLSTGVLMIELSALYRGENPPLPLCRYRDYVMWQETVTAADDTLKSQEDYWLKRFDDAPDLPVLSMPCDFPRPELRSFEGRTDGLDISYALYEQLHEMARQYKTTLFVLMLTIYNTLLYKYTHQEVIIIGIPITGRSHRDVQEIVGMFVNTLALRNFPTGGKTFESFLQEVKKDTLEAYANQFYQFEDLVEKLELPRDLSRNPVFDVMFVLHTVDIAKINFPGVELRTYGHEHPACRFDMTLNVAESTQGIGLALEYTTALFKKETMQRFLDDFVSIAEAVIGNPKLTLEDIPTRQSEKIALEKQKILDQFNATGFDYPMDRTLSQLLEEQALRTPGHRAVVCTGHEEPENNRVLDYNELNREANRLAMALKAKGIGPGDIVPLMTGRTVEMLIALIAVLKTGAAYLPIGHEYPEERIRYLVSYSDARVVLVSGITVSFDTQVEVIDVPAFLETGSMANETSEEREGGADKTGNPSDLAYVIFTSGTTGTPKGVMIENRAVVNFIEAIHLHVPFTTEDTILSLTTITFDIFGLETLLPLTKGSTVLMGSVEQQLDSTAASQVLRQEKVSILQLTPSRLKLFLSNPDASNGLEELKYLLVGGEPFPLPLLEQVRKLTKARIFNVYGPTETTIWSTIKEVTQGPLNIGKPLANTHVYIVGNDGKMQPMGVPGELCISGHGVARGYFKDDLLTSEKFIPNPFLEGHSRDVSGHSLLYRTGDLAYWSTDGSIEFLGRVDHQLKIRGFRIEPGEIEHCLTNHEAIREAVVLPKEEEDGEKYLAAYIVTTAEMEIPQLREYLSESLPDYMIPSFFIRIESIPLTRSGKVDRNKLLNIEGSGLKPRGEYIAPGTELEQTIADTWKEFLKIESVGIEDNFFDLGGTSVKILGIVSKLKETLDRAIPVVTMFRYPTVSSMAKYLENAENVPQRKDRTEIKKKAKDRLARKRDRRKK